MLCPRGVTKTIVLKSPDSDRVREVIVTSVLLPKSENENNRTFVKSESNCGDLGSVMEKRTCKRRLDHLTLEEKILRKKLKNREAAQTSRDRKKARLEELETTVVQLQNENESLHEEVRSLKDERETLLRENARLTEEVWRLSVGGPGPAGPAVSPPLPQGAPPPHRSTSALPPPPAPLLATLLTTLLVTVLAASSTTTGTGSTRFLSILQLLKSLSNSPTLCLLKLTKHKNQNHRKKAWWGRRQRAWNPVGLRF
ncbi:X-box-binding protein 1 [Macrosteles quadrilineatus]|uniref:X-box-binding protein 1 n=1 Tax=Macrosteles quadrilineatus TaxID=74068 RepID=UPI0023E23032|nr:X-box-binding protein 1 [Macrosteles quadrilineatus]